MCPHTAIYVSTAPYGGVDPGIMSAAPRGQREQHPLTYADVYVSTAPYGGVDPAIMSAAPIGAQLATFQRPSLPPQVSL